MGEVAINLVSKRLLASMTTPEKIRYILDEVKGNKILVLESGLDAVEEAKLIETTMAEIDHQTFIGIELTSHQPEAPKSWMEKVLSQLPLRRTNMTVVGPADRLKTVRKDGATIEARILANPVAGG